MSVTENIDRIEQGKTSIISSIKSKGVNVPNDVLINEIAPYINEIQGGSGGGDTPEGEIVPGGPHSPENDVFQEDFLWIENVDDTDGTITLNLEQTPFIYYSYDDDTEFQKMVSTNVLSIPAHSKIYLRWKGRIGTSSNGGFIKNVSTNCNHNIGGELKNGGLKNYVYQYLFYNDTKLIDASELNLSATALAEYCYHYMFYNCTSLTTAPALPATSLASNCYRYMFYNCTSLTTAPALPATSLASYCYYGMFQNCSNLTYIKTNGINWDTSYASYWLSGASPSGIVECPADSKIPSDSTSGVPSGWTKQIDTSFKNSINIHNISGLENTISIPNKYSAFKYKTNNDTEYTENPRATALTITLKADETLTIEGIYYPRIDTNEFNGITSTENINVYGEVSYSIPYMFNCLFKSSTKLIDASELKLSATSLAECCYTNMFNNCTILTTVPFLPATSLATNCYRYMFYNCTSLTTAPALPATSLASNCYYGMFQNCSKLTTAPELPATELKLLCYSVIFYDCRNLNSLTYLSTEPFIYNDSSAKQSWLFGVASTGTFRTPIENKEWIETYPRGNSAVPSGWTIEYIE